MSQPNPFEIRTLEDGVRVASNGQTTVVARDPEATMIRRRGITGIGARPPGELILPELNALAGDILNRLDMPAAELQARIKMLAAMSTPNEPQNIEWLVVTLGDVKVYVDKENVIVTREDLRI